MNTTQQPVGALLRGWRQRRRLSQMELALEADVSTRHVSFLENGRSQPSREMLLRLAEELDIPLRDRNVMLVAAGFAPLYAERQLDDPALFAVRRAVDLVLMGHEPYPAIAIDRHWTLVSANRAVASLFTGIDPVLLKPPLNVVRLSLHPDGLAPRIENLAAWRAHIFNRLSQQIDISADPILEQMLDEFRHYPGGEEYEPRRDRAIAGVVVPILLRTEHGLLSLFLTTTIFGTPVDVTLSELAIESFFPADDETAETLRAMASNWYERGGR